MNYIEQFMKDNNIEYGETFEIYNGDEFLGSRTFRSKENPFIFITPSCVAYLLKDEYTIKKKRKSATFDEIYSAWYDLSIGYYEDENGEEWEMAKESLLITQFNEHGESENRQITRKMMQEQKWYFK